MVCVAILTSTMILKSRLCRLQVAEFSLIPDEWLETEQTDDSVTDMDRLKSGRA